MTSFKGVSPGKSSSGTGLLSISRSHFSTGFSVVKSKDSYRGTRVNVRARQTSAGGY